MFDIGFAELVIVAIVALVVIGPEQLPATIRTVSLWLGRIRRGFQQAKEEIEREIGADEIRTQLRNESIMKSFNESRAEIRETMDAVNEQINAQSKELSSALPDLFPEEKKEQSPPKTD